MKHTTTQSNSTLTKIIPNRLRMRSRMTEPFSWKATSIICWSKVSIVWEHSQNCFKFLSCATRHVLVRWTSFPYLLDELPLYWVVVHHGFMVVVLRRLHQHHSKLGNPEINTPSVLTMTRTVISHYLAYMHLNHAIKPYNNIMENMLRHGREKRPYIDIIMH